MDRRSFLIGTGATATAAWTAAGQDLARSNQIADQPPVSSQAASGPGLEQRMAQYAADVRFPDFPPKVVQACKRYLLDALACAFGAVSANSAKITQEVLRKTFGLGGSATIIGSPDLISTEGATLINGTLIRELEFNDIYFGKDPAHPSEIISAAIACCEEAGRSGQDLIEAIVVGYELEVRLSDALSWASRGFISSTAAAFVVPLVAGKAWRMPVEQLVQAIGISGPRQLTTLAVNSGEISMMKSVGPGYTAMDGVFSTRLAAAGMTGVTGSIEWVTANIQPKDAQVSIDLDLKRNMITKVGVRRFPLQGDLQALAEAGVNLHSKIQGQDQMIREISVQVYPETIERGVARPEKYQPTSRGTADHSLPICLAIALLDGDLTTKQFDDGRWKALDVFALAGKVKVEIGKELMAKMPEGHGTIVEVRFNSGQTVKESVLIPEGDAEKPMSRAASEHKFRQFADAVLGEGESKKVIEYIDHLEDIKDIREFTAALRPQRRS
jgi:2-methylcitrate dehydratase